VDKARIEVERPKSDTMGEASFEVCNVADEAWVEVIRSTSDAMNEARGKPVRPTQEKICEAQVEVDSYEAEIRQVRPTCGTIGDAWVEPLRPIWEAQVKPVWPTCRAIHDTTQVEA